MKIHWVDATSALSLNQGAITMSRPVNSVSPYIHAVVLAVAAWFVMAPMAAAQIADPTEDVVDEVVVVATRTEVDLADAPASVSVLTSEDLGLTASIDVMDAVRQTAGITFQGRGVGGRQVLSIRGMSSEQTLFLMDGRRTLATDSVIGHSDFQYNWLPINAVERIEVVRGPLSALYGSDALGGVVNITTRPVPASWAGSVSSRYGSTSGPGDESYAGLYAAGPLGDRLGALFSYTFNNFDDVPSAANPVVSELEGRESRNLFGRLSFQPAEEHAVYVDFSSSNEDRNYFTQSRGGVDYESIYDLDKQQVGAGYRGQIGEADVSFGAYFAEFDSVHSATEGQRAFSPQTLKHSVIDGNVAFAVTENHRVLIGGEVREEALEHPAIEGGESEIRFLSLFAQDEWRLSDAATLTLGARIDDHENFGSEFSPRAYLVYRLSDAWVIKGGYSHGFRAPTIKQSSPEYRFVGPHTFLGIADVGPETSDNYELSLSYFGERTGFAVTAFRNNVDDLIDIVCLENCMVPFGRVNTYINVLEAQTHGIETQADFALNDQFGVEASYVWMDTEDKSTGLALAERPEHTLHAALVWNDPDGRLAARLRAEYLGDTVSYDELGNALDLPAYTLWHAHGSWAVTEKFSLNFGVRNIGDLNLAEESVNYGYAERGRTWYAGFDLDFGQ